MTLRSPSVEAKVNEPAGLKPMPGTSAPTSSHRCRTRRAVSSSAPVRRPLTQTSPKLRTDAPWGAASASRWATVNPARQSSSACHVPRTPPPATTARFTGAVSHPQFLRFAQLPDVTQKQEQFLLGVPTDHRVCLVITQRSLLRGRQTVTLRMHSSSSRTPWDELQRPTSVRAPSRRRRYRAGPKSTSPDQRTDKSPSTPRPRRCRLGRGVSAARTIRVERLSPRDVIHSERVDNPRAYGIDPYAAATELVSHGTRQRVNTGLRCRIRGRRTRPSTSRRPTRC